MAYLLKNENKAFMQQFNPGNCVVDFNYDDKRYPESLRTLRPVIFQKDEKFHCLLGPDSESGIYAEGTTLDEVLSLWDSSLQEKIKKNANDEVSLYVIDVINASVKKAG